MKTTARLLALIACFLSGPSIVQASTVDKAAIGTTVGGAAGAGVVGTPVAGAAVGGVLGTVELGYFICVGLFGWGDPVDTTNFAVRANPALLIPALPPDSTASAGLNQASLAVIASYSEVIRNLKGVEQSRDRLAGALLVGSAADVANQQRWLAEYTLATRDSLVATAPLIDLYLADFVIEFPNLANYTVSAAEMLTTRNQEAAGNFGPIEQFILGAWGLTPFEVGIIQNQIANISDTTLLSGDPLTVRQGVAMISAHCASGTCVVPEPPVIAMIFVGLMALDVARRLRRRGAPLPLGIAA